MSMDKLSRRALLRTLTGGAVTAVGTVVLARAALTEASAMPASQLAPPDGDIQDRAVRLAEAGGTEDVTATPIQFIRGGGGGFRRGGGGGFRRGGGGGFRRGGGGFLNGGGFRNGGFRNGGYYPYYPY